MFDMRRWVTLFETPFPLLHAVLRLRQPMQEV